MNKYYLAALLAASALYLLANGVTGWGWFLFAAVIVLWLNLTTRMWYKLVP